LTLWRRCADRPHRERSRSSLLRGRYDRPQVAEGVRAAGRALEAAGYEVDEIEPPMLVESYLSWAELIWSSLKVDEDLLLSVIGDGGKKFLELTDIGFPPPPLSRCNACTRRASPSRAPGESSWTSTRWSWALPGPSPLRARL